LLYTRADSPVGELLLVGDSQLLRGLHFAAGASPPPGASADRAAFAPVLAQLGEYFAGERRTFDVPLDLRGSEFQRAVWAALLEIPYGETASYGEIARHVGRPGKARAVGRANGSNPIAVIVPCHRVIGADGTLTGYGGGLERKRLLLDLEAGRAQLGVLSQPR
jgi:methylated-DNA-[protein]-cysteine S-methyltransferase